MGDLSLIPGLGKSPGKVLGYSGQYSWSCLVAQMVKNPPAMWENWLQSVGWEDLLEESMATHLQYSCWKIPMDWGAWWATVYEFTVTHDWVTKNIRDKEGHYIMIKGSIQEEDKTFINIYASHIGVPQYLRQILTTVKGEIDNNTVIVGDFNTLTHTYG